MMKDAGLSRQQQKEMTRQVQEVQDMLSSDEVKAIIEQLSTASSQEEIVKLQQNLIEKIGGDQGMSPDQIEEMQRMMMKFVTRELDVVSGGNPIKPSQLKKPKVSQKVKEAKKAAKEAKKAKDAEMKK